MNKKLTYLALFLASISICKAQQNPIIKLSSERQTDNSVDINFAKSDIGSYYVILNFTGLSNCLDATTQTARITGHSGRLLTLKPRDQNKGIGYSYSYRYILGKDNYKPNNFVYILPFKKDTKVKVYESGYLMAKYFGKTTPTDWKCYKFYTENESTVTAARKGVVVSVEDVYSLDSLKSYSYKQENNKLIIEHADGSLARYSGFKKGSICVEEGQVVYPETVLGKNSKYSAEDKNYALSFYIFYLKPDLFADANQDKDRGVYGFVTPLFYTKKGQAVLVPKQDYYTDSNPDIVTKEMSRKELKHFKN